MKVKIKDLKIGDIVVLGDYAFSHAMVENKTEDTTVLYRPYISRPNFTYTGGAIMLTGHETMTYMNDSTTELELVEVTGIKDGK